MTWNVIWMPPAEDALAAAWLSSTNRNAITQAAHDIDVVLEMFPTAAGESVFDTVREYANSHLTVEFEVVDSDRCVYVLNVWDTAKGRPKSTGN